MIVYIYNIGVDLYNGFNGLRHRINWIYFTVLDGLAHPLYSVKEEDIPKYGKVVGTGTLIIGISLVLGFIVSFWSEEIMGYIILPAIIIGLGLILYGQFKYNKGIF